MDTNINNELAINSFTFYSNYYVLLDSMNESERLLMYDSIMNYMFKGIEPELTGMNKAIWINIKMPLDNSLKSIENGKKGGAPKGNENAKKTTKKQPKNNLKTSKKQANNISTFLFLISNFLFLYIKDSNDIGIKIKEWLEYKEERKENYTQVGLKNLLTQIENNIKKYGEEAVIKLIDDCIAKGYKGIIFEKLSGMPNVELKETEEKRETGEIIIDGYDFE